MYMELLHNASSILQQLHVFRSVERLISNSDRTGFCPELCCPAHS